MAKRFHVEGTRKFLNVAIFFLALGLWCAKDGWFPSEHYLTKYPPGSGRESRNFYLFNKSAAVLTLSLSAVCFYIHRVVK